MSMYLFQVDLKKVVDHVCDTAGHLLKPRVTLEKMVDQTTPSIAGDGSRIVQVWVCCIFRVLLIAATMSRQRSGLYLGSCRQQPLCSGMGLLCM